MTISEFSDVSKATLQKLLRVKLIEVIKVKEDFKGTLEEVVEVADDFKFVAKKAKLYFEHELASM